MNIIQIIPGSGGSFYCGNCLRDSKFYQTMRSSGHQMTKIPMYLPLFADEHDLTDIPVFYGAVSTYLMEKYKLFRNMPRWFERLLNTKPILKIAASKAGSTRAEGLEDMTISMLLGEEGRQKHELDRMITWIDEHCKPDVIHLSNALLLGLVKPIKERLKVPVVCSLQDEDVWVDAMRPEFADKVWNLMNEKAQYVDRFIAVSDYYAEVSIERMRLPKEKVERIYLGVDPDDYAFVNSTIKSRNLGYISRMCYENGFDIVVDAFILLRQKEGFEDVKLIVTGGHTDDDNKYIEEQRKKLKKNKLLEEVDFIDSFDDFGKLEFFNKTSLLSVPVRKGEAFGIYLTEAMASGIPVVQPNLGAFPEIVELSGGGAIFSENTPEKLSEQIAKIMVDEDYWHEISQNAYRSIMEHFNIYKLSNSLLESYEQLLKPGNLVN